MRMEKHIARTIIVAVFMLWSSLHVRAWDLDLAMEAGSLLGEQEFFAAAIVQDGELHPVRNAPIRLRREPFAIVVVTHEPDGVLVNASPEPDFYAGIRNDESLDEILDEPEMFMGMAEYFFNPDRELFVSTVFPHYLFFNSHSEHRYDFVHLTPREVIGYRTVEYLLDIDTGSGRYSVAEWEGPLYLSFYYTAFENGERIEIQRKSAKVVFRG